MKMNKKKIKVITLIKMKMMKKMKIVKKIRIIKKLKIKKIYQKVNPQLLKEIHK
jgi:hypothetical protein